MPKFRFLVVGLTVWLGLGRGGLAAAAPTLNVPTGLSFAEIQITGDEFIVLQNNSGGVISDLSNYWLYYFNKTDPSTTKPAFIQLPAGRLENNQTVLLSTIGRPTCGASIVDNLSTSLVDSGGFLELVKFSVSANGVINQNIGDGLSWSSGTNGVIQKVASATPQPIYYRYQATSLPTYSWQKAAISSSDACQLTVTGTGSAPNGPVNMAKLNQAKSSPPATILYIEPADGGSILPAGDLGLEAPQLSEIMPNPKSPQTDANDEFIELYNPNDKSFDLSGFKLIAGTDGSHDFTFGQGTTLKPKSFTFFVSAVTHLTLTNDGGQVSLQDPAGRVISQTDVYDSAKDGQSWSLANGRWYWTGHPTPGMANIVDQSSGSNSPTPAGQISSNSPNSSSAKKLSYSTGPYSSLSSINPSAAKAKSSPLHPAILVGIGLLALSYGLYEYRHDLANTLEKFRRHRRTRQAAGEDDKTGASAGIAQRFRGWQDHFRPGLGRGTGDQTSHNQPNLHSQPRVSGSLWYEALPFRLLSPKRIRRARRPTSRGSK